MTASDALLAKRATGIPGLDAVTRGGLPAAGGVLVVGEAGSGKTVLGLQVLARATEHGDGGVLVSFEETVAQIHRDAASFSWGPQLLASDRWEMLDARPPADADVAGGFDLEGLLAAIGAALDRLGGSWLVLDGVDQLLRLQPDAGAAAMQVRRLHDWCEARGITLLLSGKRDNPGSTRPEHLDGVEYMLSTVLALSTELVERRLNRRFRVVKYRGSGHVTDELPLIMDEDGLHLPYSPRRSTEAVPAPSERLSTGIPRLDHVLGGGLFRGSTTLVSGAPGTAKTTVAVSIAHGAAARGEKVLYLSFDELADRIVRNVTSLGIDLHPHMAAGRLHVESREAWSTLVEEHFTAILRRLDALEPDWLIIDPISALLKAASAEGAYMSTERLLGSARARGITTVLTSLTGIDAIASESTLSHTSTLADTWIVLDYRVLGGERNRALSVVKSRGAAHSNQVRELVLSSDGVTLADTYQYGSEVLMGTARIQKEAEEQMMQRRQSVEREQRRRDLERHIEQARMRMQEARSEAERLQEELERELRDSADSEQEARVHDHDVRRRREPGNGATGDRSNGGEDP